MSNNKVYVKEGVGFEGISMMENGNSNMPKLIIFIIVAVALFGALAFGLSHFFGSSKKDTSKSPAITILPTSIPEDMPTETPLPTVSVAMSPTKSAKTTPSLTPSPTVSTGKQSPTPQKTKNLSVEVLNGSGTKGAAKEMADVLIAAGYTVAKTDNADVFTYTGVTISLKADKKLALDQLKKDLSTAGYLVTKSDTALAAAETVDAVVIVGAE